MITPLPFGGGEGGGAIIFLKPCVFCSSVFSVRKNMSFLICHYVILSYKNHQFLPVTLLFCLQKKHLFLSVTLLFCLQKKHLSPFVIMLFCLQKNICLSLSHYVILSENAPVGDGSGPSCCCYCYVSFCLISAFHKLYYVLPHYLSSIYSF